MPEGLSYTWKTKMLGIVCQLSGGYGFPDSLQGSIEGELPFIKVSDMSLPRNERIIVNANNYVSMRIADSMGWKPFPAGAVVFAKVGAALKLNRRRILIRPTIIDNNMMAAIPYGDLDSAFLYHFLCTIDFGDFVQDGALPSVNQEQIGSIKIPDINKGEQRRIAEILDTIDEAIQKTEALISKLKAMKQGLLHDLLTRGLDKNGKLRDPKSHPEQFKDSTLGRIPRIWATPTLDEITTAPICYGIVQVGPYANTGVPVLAIRDLHSNYVSNVHKTAPGIDKQYTRSRVASGDLLLSIKGTIGRIGVVPPFFVGNISRDLARIRVIRDVMPDYLRYMFESPFGQNRLSLTVVGTTRAELSIGRLKELCVLIPPLDEQKQITVILDSHSTRVRTEEQYRDKLKLQKKGLMHDLLTGKVRVRM